MGKNIKREKAHPKVILDFDYTLFDTAKFKRDLARSLRIWRIPPAVFFKYYPRAIRRHNGEYTYDVKKHLDLLKRYAPNLPLRQAKKHLDKVIKNSYKYLYRDAVKLLKSFNSLGYQLMLFTHGEKLWQQKKLRYSGITSFFKKIIITKHLKVFSLKRFLENHENVAFVSDHVDELLQVKNKFPDWLVIAKIGGHNKGSIKELHLPKFNNLLKIENFIINHFKKTKIGVCQ